MTPQENSPPVGTHLRSGVLFEERFIVTTLRDIEMMREFADIADEKREQIISLLEILKNDSIGHEKVLTSLAEHYS